MERADLPVIEPESREYFPESARLTMENDGGWLSELIGRPIDEDTLQLANELVERGSISLKGRRGKSRTTVGGVYSDVKSAREEFFEDVLGWCNPDHPQHKAYLRMKSPGHSFPLLSTFVTAQRLYDSLDFPVTEMLQKWPSLVTVTADAVNERIRAVTDNGIPVSKLIEYPRFFSMPTQKVIENLTRPRPVRVGSMATKHLIGRPKKPAYVVELERAERMQNLVDWGLDDRRIARKEPSILLTTPETVNKRILTIKAILRYIGSNQKYQDVINDRPNLIVSSDTKLRSLVRILNGSVDPEYIAQLDAKKLGQFITPPIDSVFAAVARHKTLGIPGTPLVRQSLVNVQNEFSSKEERRAYSLDLLANPAVRRAVGRRVIKAYLDYRPLKSHELRQRPELAEVLREIQRPISSQSAA